MGSAPTTIYTRRQQLQRVARTIEVTDPWTVDGAGLLAWWHRLAPTWRPDTRRGHRAALRGFYRWGVEHAHLPAPSPAAVLPRVRPSPPNPMPVPDAAYLPALAAADDRERLMLLLAADHGLRRGEIVLVNPARDLVEDLGGWSLLVHGKGGKERIVPLTGEAARLLRALAPGYAFPGDVDGHLSPRWCGTLVNRLLPGSWTIHKLRHRAGTRWWERSDGDLAAVQELLGHASPKTTMVYVRVGRDKLRRIVTDAAA